MAEPHSLAGRVEEIRGLIGANDLPSAFTRLLDFVRDFSRNGGYLDEVTVISMNFRTIEDAHRRSSMPFGEYMNEKAKVVFKALELMRVVAAEVAEAPTP